MCLSRGLWVCVRVLEVCDRKTCQFSSIQSACFAHCRAPLQVYVQFNSMKTYKPWMDGSNVCCAALLHSTPPTHQIGTSRNSHTHIYRRTANRSDRFERNVINNLRWKSKPDFWFSFFIFSHISSNRVVCVRVCERCCVGVRCYLSIC